MVPISPHRGSCPVQSQRFIEGGGKCRCLPSVDEGNWSQITKRPIRESKCPTRMGSPTGRCLGSPGLGDGQHSFSSTQSRESCRHQRPPKAALWETPAHNSCSQQLTERYSLSQAAKTNTPSGIFLNRLGDEYTNQEDFGDNNCDLLGKSQS